jgi:hypothetical protein
MIVEELRISKGLKPVPVHHVVAYLQRHAVQKVIFCISKRISANLFEE